MGFVLCLRWFLVVLLWVVRLVGGLFLGEFGGVFDCMFIVYDWLFRGCLYNLICYFAGLVAGGLRCGLLDDFLFRG